MRVKQKAFRFPEPRTWGGRRKGAGRKPKGEKAGVSHLEREALAPRFPVHVTMRVRKGLPSLRKSACLKVLRTAFARGADRFGCRVLHYAVVTNHLHLVVEAKDGRALSRGMQGLTIRVARGLNRRLGRSGKVFADRFHSHVLRTPREVKNALAYVLLNARRHGIWASKGPDPASSGASFDGWRDHRPEPGFLPRARTWLLRTGWRRHGLLSLDPRASSP